VYLDGVRTRLIKKPRERCGFLIRRGGRDVYLDGIRTRLIKKTARTLRLLNQAGRAGFEPAVEVLFPDNHLAGGPIQPLWHLPKLLTAHSY